MTNVFPKRGNLDTETHLEDNLKRPTEKTAIPRPKREAWNTPFPQEGIIPTDPLIWTSNL